MKLKDFPGNTVTMVCQHIFDQSRPIKLVMRDQESMLLMLCGEEDHDWDNHRPRVVGIGHLLERDTRIGELEIEAGYEANLVNSTWMISKTPEEDLQ